MNANTTTPNTGTIFYDGECAFCIGWARRYKLVLAKRGFALTTLQSRTGIRPETVRQNARTIFTEIRLALADGRELGGADAVVEIARRVWWAWPLFMLTQLPGAMPLLRAGYRIFAARRHCLNGVCAMNRPIRRRTIAFLELP